MIKLVALTSAAILWASLGLAVGPDPAPGPVEQNATYQKARSLIGAGQYRDAIVFLEAVRAEHRDSADIANWLGFAYRKTKDFAKAKANYDRALAIDPNHKGAREYLGELYVETGEMGKAREQLEALARICGSCEEHKDLATAIAKATPRS
jgi:tetratricopeptide (TPR) repeat protein